MTACRTPHHQRVERRTPVTAAQPYRVGASFFLPHQCDEWVIGEGDQAIEEMRAFIAECQAVLDAALTNPNHDTPPTITP